MEVKKMWVFKFDIIVLLQDGTYRKGITTNVFFFETIDEEKALNIINSYKNK
jgi:hypothetical protein